MEVPLSSVMSGGVLVHSMYVLGSPECTHGSYVMWPVCERQQACRSVVLSVLPPAPDARCALPGLTAAPPDTTSLSRPEGKRRARGKQRKLP